MRLIILFGFLIFGLGANAQIKMLNILESYPVPNQPEVISVDTSIIIDYINPIETSNNSDSTLMIRLKDYEIRIVRSDSSILRFFSIENGLLKNHKRHGKWTFIEGNYNNMIRIAGQKHPRFYFNGYEIYFERNITKSINININTNTANCDFTYVNRNNDSINLIIDYWINKNGIIMTKCKTISGAEIFSVTIDYLQDELRLLFFGYYNRKIRKSLTKQN